MSTTTQLRPICCKMCTKVIGDTPEMCHSRQHSHNITIPDSNYFEVLTTNVLHNYQSMPARCKVTPCNIQHLVLYTGMLCEKPVMWVFLHSRLKSLFLMGLHVSCIDMRQHPKIASIRTHMRKGCVPTFAACFHRRKSCRSAPSLPRSQQCHLTFIALPRPAPLRATAPAAALPSMQSELL